MYLFTILSTLICIQLISIATSDTTDASQSSQSNTLVQPSAILDSEEIFNNDDENYEESVRASEFLRFGRQVQSASPSFLRFGRSQPGFLRFGRAGQNGGTFLRFGRQTSQQQPASNNFLRFGRQFQQPVSSNFLRFGRNGEFLRFG